MAYLKSDFLSMLAAEVMSRPAAAEAYRAGDPLLMAQVNSFAAWMAAVSAQTDVAEVEPFLKARDGTVLADASLKGLLPLAKPAAVQLSVANPSAAPVTLGVGRTLVDGKGRIYTVDGAATIAAGATGAVTARQQTRRTASHTVAGAGPFYAVQVPPSDEDSYITGVEVADALGDFRYAVEFCNVGAGERIFHAETDEFRRLWLRFGANDVLGAVVGHQVADGEILTMTIYECSGAIALDVGSTFALETTTTAAEAAVTITLSALTSLGADPPAIETLRTLARYPGAHDSNAVFLGDFDFLVRRKVDGLQFLAVWNEQAEEAVRGPSVDNINVLFVSYSTTVYSDAVVQAKIKAAIAAADDSYQVKFIPAVVVPVTIKISASVSAVHSGADVRNQIATLMLASYGLGSDASARGLSKTFRLQEARKILIDNVPALQDQLSDFDVSVSSPTTTVLPEQFRYCTAGTVAVTITQVTDSLGLWSS